MVKIVSVSFIYALEIMGASDMFKISKMEGRGVGWIATKHIRKGDKIWTETPILNNMEHLIDGQSFAFILEIDEAVDNLSEKNKKLFLNLNDPEDMGDEAAMKNIRIYNDNVTPWGLYIMASRLNHSCQPNAIWSSDTDMPPFRAVEVRALRNIPHGEEITVSYIRMSDLLSKEERQHKLSSWGFVCGCSLCSLEDIHLKKNDEIRKYLSQGIGQIELFLDSLQQMMPRKSQVNVMVQLGLKSLRLVETNLASDVGTGPIILRVLRRMAVLSALADAYRVTDTGCENPRYYRDRAWREAEMLGEMFLTDCLTMDQEMEKFILISSLLSQRIPIQISAWGGTRVRWRGLDM